MSKQCSECVYWGGNDSNFSANCTQHNQNTAFDFSCPLFSPRQKLKNYSGDRGETIKYYASSGKVSVSFDGVNWTELRGTLGLDGSWTSELVFLQCYTRVKFENKILIWTGNASNCVIKTWNGRIDIVSVQ